MKSPTQTQRGLFVPVFLGTILGAIFLHSPGVAAPRPPMPPLPELVRACYAERFDEFYTRDSQATEIKAEGLGRLVESWSGYALERRGVVLPFVVDGVRGGATNLFPNGAVRLWLKPDWSSASTGAGKGPGHAVTLLEYSVVGKGQALPVWSLHLSADGALLYLLGAGQKEAELLLKAEVKWAAGEWHQVLLNYTEKGTSLVVDGELVAEGAGVWAVPSSAAALTVGSRVTGTESIEGELEEVYCFVRPLRNAFHYQAYKELVAHGPMTLEELAYRAELAAKWKAAKTLKAQEEAESGGGLMLRMMTSSITCITNAPLFITNTVCTFDPSTAWTVSFEIQGTNSPADIFTTTNLSGSNITNAFWVWLERGPTCATYQYTNQPVSQSYYVLGSMLDSDGDGLTDAYERLTSKTNPALWDTDGDGLSDGWEIAHGTNPLGADPAVSFVAEPKTTSNIP